MAAGQLQGEETEQFPMWRRTNVEKNWGKKPPPPKGQAQGESRILSDHSIDEEFVLITNSSLLPRFCHCDLWLVVKMRIK